MSLSKRSATSTYEASGPNRMSPRQGLAVQEWMERNRIPIAPDLVYRIDIHRDEKTGRVVSAEFHRYALRNGKKYRDEETGLAAVLPAIVIPIESEPFPPSEQADKPNR